MISTKEYIKATSVSHAISLANANDGCFRYLAGGTDVMANKFQGNDETSLLIDISELKALKEVYTTESHLVIGAMVCLDDIKNHPLIAVHFPSLAAAANAVASPTIRKTATFGGNLLCENRCIYSHTSSNFV